MMDTPAQVCAPQSCYKDFTESEVNNQIYPWSTYAYLPSLLILCPLAELVSYRAAILIGIFCRVITRFLLLFGTSLEAMALMQVTYAAGTASEDIFYAYVFYAVPTGFFQIALSACRTSALVSCLIASVLGDLLVTQADTPLTVLQIISCVSVCAGALLGCFVLSPSGKTRQFVECGGVPLAVAASEAGAGGKIPNAKDVALGGWVVTTTSNPTSMTSSDDCAVENSRSAASSYSSGSNVWYRKGAIFIAQAKFFRETLNRNPNLQNQVLYWIVANATYTEIFGYEVAVFEQLNGGRNTWNGSVLSVMLLLGAVGAMAPVFMKLDAGMYSAHFINALVSIAGIAGSIFLLVFCYVWRAIPSLAMLSLFVACWQFISVIVLVQVATELKISHDRAFPSTDVVISSMDDRESLSKGLPTSSTLSTAASAEAEPPSYAIAIVSLVGVSVVLQNSTVTIVFSGLQLSLQQALLCPSYLFAIATFIFACASLRRRHIDAV